MNSSNRWKTITEFDFDVFCEPRNWSSSCQTLDWPNKSSLLNQELVRLLQQTLRTSQSDRQPLRRPPPVPDSSAASDQTQAPVVTQEEIAQLETLLQDKDEQIQSLCGHMERLALEKESLQQELKGLKIISSAVVSGYVRCQSQFSSQLNWNLINWVKEKA